MSGHRSKGGRQLPQVGLQGCGEEAATLGQAAGAWEVGRQLSGSGHRGAGRRQLPRVRLQGRDEEGWAQSGGREAGRRRLASGVWLGQEGQQEAAPAPWGVLTGDGATPTWSDPCTHLHKKTCKVANFPTD